MTEVFSGVKDKISEDLSHLRDACQKALAFSTIRATELALSDDAVRRAADQEASFGRIAVDENGLTPGMYLHILQPLHNTLAEWRNAKAAFTTALQPFVTDLDAMEKLDFEIAELRGRREQVKESINRKAAEDHNYVGLERRRNDTYSRYETLRDKEGRRNANLAAYSWWYWIGLLLIGVAEWLINYDTFFFFLGIPAIAAGTTIIMGVLLAFAAHGHGTLLRQWSAFFGEDKSGRERWGGYRFLALTTLALVLVVGTAGASRYEFALHIVIDQPSMNILGEQSKIDVNPVKDVSLSLMGNVAAWAVGVFLAYFCHDRNPDYMDAASAWSKAEQQFLRVRRPYDEDIRTQEAKIQREITDAERSATVRSGGVNEQRSLLKQVVAHDQSMTNALLATLRRNIEQYRAALTNLAISGSGNIKFIRGGQELNPYEYQALKLVLDPELVLPPSN